jgi:hypothetical protein
MVGQEAHPETELGRELLEQCSDSPACAGAAGTRPPHRAWVRGSATRERDVGRTPAASLATSSDACPRCAIRPPR